MSNIFSPNLRVSNCDMIRYLITFALSLNFYADIVLIGSYTHWAELNRERYVTI